MKRCYCASNISFDGENHVLLASEDPEIACNMYYGKDFEKKQNVWTTPGGCMSIVPIPGKEKEIPCCTGILFKSKHHLQLSIDDGENGNEIVRIGN